MSAPSREATSEMTLSGKQPVIPVLSRAAGFSINNQESTIINPQSLQMKFPTTPIFWSNIGNGLSEIPSMPVKVLRIVLPLAVRMLYRFAQNDGSVLPRAFAVLIGAFDPHLHALRMIRRHISFANGEAALARLHLDSVIGNTQTNRETKSLRKPIGCRTRIGISEHWNYGARRDGSVKSHPETLSLNGKRHTPWISWSQRSWLYCGTIFSTLPE